MPLGLIYSMLKDFVEALHYKEQDKLVDRNYLEISGLAQEKEAEGYTLRWTVPSKIETRRLQGYDVIYEIHKIDRIRIRLVRDDGSVLMGKKTD